MSFFGTIASWIAPHATGATPASGYTFGEQHADFIKLQFRYGLLLKRRLDSGSLPGMNTNGQVIPYANGPTPDEQLAYYENHLWLTTQTLTPPYDAWWGEFRTAIESEDLVWLSHQVGQTVEQLTAYMGDALGSVAASALSGVSGGLARGFFGSLNVYGWLTLGAIGIGVYYGFKKGFIQKAFKTGVGSVLPKL